MFDDPPRGDRGHDLVRVPSALPAAIAQRKGDGVGEVARLGGREAVGLGGHPLNLSRGWRTKQERGDCRLAQKQTGRRAALAVVLGCL